MASIFVEFIRTIAVTLTMLVMYNVIGFEITLLTIVIIGFLVVTSQLHDILKEMGKK